MFPLFSNIFLDTNSSNGVDVDADDNLDRSINNNRYTYCYVGGCNCKRFVDDDI
jgi:hypothetical protein